LDNLDNYLCDDQGQPIYPNNFTNRIYDPETFDRLDNVLEELSDDINITNDGLNEVDDRLTQLRSDTNGLLAIVQLAQNHQQVGSGTNGVDFSALINQNCPQGYRYFFGFDASVYPLATWDYATKIVRVAGTAVEYATTVAQAYAVSMKAVYVKVLN